MLVNTSLDIHSEHDEHVLVSLKEVLVSCGTCVVVLYDVTMPTYFMLLDRILKHFFSTVLTHRSRHTVAPPILLVRSWHAHCPAPFQATATMLLPGEVTATAWLLAAYTVTSSPPDSALTR